MPLITPEQKEADPNWYDHLKVGDYFHTGNPTKCGICGCESDFFEIVAWMGMGRKMHLICPGNKINSKLHQKIDRKRDFLLKDVLPPRAAGELKHEIAAMIAQIQTEVRVAARQKSNSPILRL